MEGWGSGTRVCRAGIEQVLLHQSFGGPSVCIVWGSAFSIRGWRYCPINISPHRNPRTQMIVSCPFSR